MRHFRLAAFAFVVLASGCGLLPQGETYPLTATEMRDQLELVEPPMGVLGSQATDWRRVTNGDGSIAWLVLDRDSRELLRFVVRTEAEGQDETRVIVSVEPPEGRLKAAVAERFDSHGAVRDLYEAAMAEEIDAFLENRGFDFTRIAGHTTRATVSMLPEISADLDRAAAEWQREDRENIARAYQNEAIGGGWGSTHEPAFGEPMEPPTE